MSVARILHWLVLVLLAPVAARAQSPRLEVSPHLAIADETISLRITGLAPNVPIILRAARSDTAGHVWQSFAGFRANARGVVEVARQAPANGSYAGVQPMGLFTSMDVGGALRDRLRYPYAWDDTLRTALSVESEGRTLAADTVSQVFRDRAVSVESIRDSGLVATYFHPTHGSRGVGVLVLGGSEGGLSSEDVAAQLASHGLAALTLAYFGADALPAELDRIPIEYFARALRLLARRPEVDRRRIAILGTSKGAEAALIVASADTSVRAVVAYAPSSVAWSCICSEPHSSWTRDGADLTSVPAGADPTYRPPQGFPLQPGVHYRFRMHDPEVRARAAIAVERIRGPLLLVAGERDAIWPSADMARMLLTRRRAHHVPYADSLLLYSDAGHLIGKAFLPAGTTLVGGGRLETGGRPAANAAAQADAWPRVLRLLQGL